MKVVVGLNALESTSAKQVKMASQKAKKAGTDVKADTLTTLIPVQLPTEELDTFVKAFHPKRAAKGPQAFMEEARFLIEVSAYLNAIFAGLRYGLTSLHLTGPALGDVISRDIAITYKNRTELEKKAKEFLMNLASGRHHIIRDSIRFKGGKDIIYSGLRGPNASPLLSSDVSHQVSLPVATDMMMYQNKAAAYQTETGKALIATGMALQKLFFGDSAAQVSQAYARLSQQHQIGPKTSFVEEVTRILMRGPLAKLGIPITLPTFDGTQTEHSVNRMKEYVSILALREPVASIVDRKKSSKGSPDESLNISMEAVALQPDIRFSFVINIPKNFCEYITQTKEEQIPLVPLNTWANIWSAAMLRPPNTRTSADDRSQRAQGAKILIPQRAPQYVLRPSVSDELIKRRKDLGLYSEAGRVNEDGIYITYNGDLGFMPGAADSSVKIAKDYEKISEEALALSFEAGTPLAAGQRGSTGAIFDIASPNYAEKIANLKAELHKYTGTVQAINWDLNIVLTVSVTDPGRLVSTKLVGGNKPEPLNLATYLRSNFGKGMRDMFSRSRMVSKDGVREGVTSASFANATNLLNSTVFNNFAQVYNHFLKLEKVPDFDALVKLAADELKIKSLDDEAVVDYEVSPIDTNKTIYKGIINKALEVTDPAAKIQCGQTVLKMLGYVAWEASASSGSNLARLCIKDNIEFSDHERYFSGSVSNVGEFSRLYQWLGGQIFLQAIRALLAIPRKELLDTKSDALPTDTDVHPGFLSLASEVMPMCVLLGKYVMPEFRDAVYKAADEAKENDFTEADLNLAGSKPKNKDGKGGMKLFPHQAEALRRLKAHPKIAVLDISPGGGKTTIGLADIAMLYADKLIKRPFVFCPNRLVKNWMEDLHKSFNGWNIVPVTTETYAEWGEERLTELLLNAPPNTIVVVGNSFISNTEKTPLVIGNAVDIMSNAVEFCKKFEPDYVLLDESHRIRNPRSAIHQGIKAINQMSSVKYGRIGTGTLIQNVLSDVVGQAAIFNGQIFRTVDEFEEEHKGVVAIVNDKPVIDYMEDTPLKARRRLAEFAEVISFKRKEWAFMLPMPVETFITVDMEAAGDLGHKLQQFYNAVLKQTLEEAKNDPRLKKRKKGEEDEDDENGESEDRTVTSANGVSLDVSDVDDDSDNEDELEAALQPYLQRLERILTDPFGDDDLVPVAKEIFGDDFTTDYVTPKVQRVVDRIKNHFADKPWKKGAVYSASSLVDYGGKSYIFKSDLPFGTGEERSDTPPDVDTKNWKPQIKGKVFVACRYTRSVEAIYRALPPELQKHFVRFHGEAEGKDDNLARFQDDDKVWGLIGNEMGISEGHNFQMATRFIRVEAPWAPGELDQTASRVFRPDVGGEYTKQTIFLDWILCDNTLEVAKMGRLVSKMLKRTKFDELDNPTYYKNLNPRNLPIIKMSLDNIKQLNRLSDLCSIAGEGDIDNIHEHSYMGQYGYLVNQMGEEFREMRKTKRAYMIDVEPTPMPEGSAILEFTPWVPNVKVPDRNNDGLIPLREALEEDTDLARAFKVDRKALLGQFVRTEFGLGTIVGVTTKRGTSSDEDSSEDTGNEISKVRVKLEQGGNVDMLSASKVFLATNITERTRNKYNKKAPKITEADKERTAKNRDKGERTVDKVKAKAKAASENLKRRVREPVEEEPELEEDTGAEKNVLLYPVIYNEFLALEGLEDAADSKALHRFGFNRFGAYAYLPVKTYQNFTAVLDFLEKKYTLSPKTIKYLDMLHDSFQSGRGRKFNVALSPTSEFPQFYRMRHMLTKVTDRKKPEIKLYPVLINGNLVLVVDLDTNPIFKRQVGKAIPGVTGNNKFQEADGMDIHFFRNKSELISKVKELRKNGFTIGNLDELKEEVGKLSLKTLSKE